jgi:hypothetical protein
MNEESKRWIEAGEILAGNASAQVICPRCHQAILNVKDVAPASDSTLVERHLSCPKCGAYNALRLRRTGTESEI